jgi:hypothetical protein
VVVKGAVFASTVVAFSGAWLDLIITGGVVVAREFIVGGMNGNGPFGSLF